MMNLKFVPLLIGFVPFSVQAKMTEEGFANAIGKIQSLNKQKAEIEKLAKKTCSQKHFLNSSECQELKKRLQTIEEATRSACSHLLIGHVTKDPKSLGCLLQDLPSP